MRMSKKRLRLERAESIRFAKRGTVVRLMRSGEYSVDYVAQFSGFSMRQLKVMQKQDKARRLIILVGGRTPQPASRY